MNIAYTALRIADTLSEQDVLYIAEDEQQGEAVAAVLTALVGPDVTFHIPASDALPGDGAPPTPANAGRRMAALHDLRAMLAQADRPRIACVLSGEAAARRYPPPASFDDAPLELRVGQSLVPADFAAALEANGYIAHDPCEDAGEVALRGDVIDIFPAAAPWPARIELTGAQDTGETEIAAIRSYDPISQRSLSDIDRLTIGPAAEPACGDPVPILDHLDPCLLVASEAAERQRKRFIELARDAANAGPIDAIADAEWSAAAGRFHLADWSEDFAPVPRFAEARAPLSALTRWLRPLLAQGRRLVLVGSARDLRFLTPKLAQRLDLELSDADWAGLRQVPEGGGAFIVLPVDAGFVDYRWAVIAAADLLGSRAQTDAGAVAAGQPWAHLAPQIALGDVVVHQDHGVGRVLGLGAASDAGEMPGEMIVLGYANGGRRLVAIDEGTRIWRYGGDGDAVALDRLDGSSWQKRRGEIEAAIVQSATALTELAAARRALVAPVMTPDAAAYERFAGGFAYHETADQARAIAAVQGDLASGRPMDRLVVGDVGYGKTEVALRAAALAALAGYQVVVAAPTTVLVRQHLDLFTRRFAASGLTVAGLSRLSSAAERKAVLAGLADGSIAIVIGTGAVMGAQVRYARLGLVIIDEEQRFGAADKARLRQSNEVHLLALSATPIPRTLQMALVGLQALSIIATPPARRQPIRTHIGEWEDARIRTALLREKSRGGQSFVVVPRIEDIAPLAERLQRLAPGLALVIAHGRMAAAAVDAVMVDFALGKGDVLLATNIIEAGLDVPRANTMVVWRADRFGLAQLHQLRGRVGRGNRRGQVLLTTADGQIGARTAKRLATLAAFDRLGAGFAISAQDLDQRGAGDLLGETQAGHMKLIGVDLYQHLLAGALAAARGEDIEDWSPELHLGAPGALPADWIPEAEIRLGLYLRLARLEEDAALDSFEEELLDRFGPLPAAAQLLLAHTRIRLAARALRIARIDAGPAAIALTPRADFAADASGLVEKNGRLLLAEHTTDEQRAGRVQQLLEELGN